MKKIKNLQYLSDLSEKLMKLLLLLEKFFLKNIWAWLFGGLFLLGLSLVIAVLNPQNILEKPMLTIDNEDKNEKKHLFVIEVENCDQKICAEKLVSLTPLQNWSTRSFDPLVGDDRKPAQVDQESGSNDLYELLVLMAQSYPDGKFPWPLLEHVNRDGHHVLSGSWPELKQTFAILQGYFFKQKKSEIRLQISSRSIEKNEWINFLTLIQKLKSVAGWSKMNKWQIIGYNQGAPTFVTFDEARKFLDIINEDKNNPYVILETLSAFQSSKARNPSQIDQKLLDQLKGQQ